MFRLIAMMWMASVLVVRRLLCDHWWRTTKEGYYATKSGRFLRATLQTCRKCGDLSVIGAYKGFGRPVGYHKVTKRFCPEVIEPGDEKIAKFKVETLVGYDRASRPQWCTVATACDNRAHAQFCLKAARANSPKGVFRIAPELDNGWSKLYHR